MANYIKATNFTAKDALPSGNAGKIIKGTEIDVEFSAIATAIASKADTNSPTFTGSPLAPTANAGTSNTQIATTAFVQNAVAGGFPSGGIIMWSGSIASIPSGWFLCDGNNGTPNLRDRFIVGAGSSYAVAATGGSANAVIVAHDHTGTTSNKSLVGEYTTRAVASGGGVSFDYTSGIVSLSENTGRSVNSVQLDGISRSSDVTTIDASHDHTFTTASSGEDGAGKNLPPYYALAFIMKA